MKYKYGDKVEVLSGFYRGETGRIEQYCAGEEFGQSYSEDSYVVRLDSDKDVANVLTVHGALSDWIDESCISLLQVRGH